MLYVVVSLKANMNSLNHLVAVLVSILISIVPQMPLGYLYRSRKLRSVDFRSRHSGLLIALHELHIEVKCLYIKKKE